VKLLRRGHQLTRSCVLCCLAAPAHVHLHVTGTGTPRPSFGYARDEKTGAITVTIPEEYQGAIDKVRAPLIARVPPRSDVFLHPDLTIVK